MKDIIELIKSQGYKYIGKGLFGEYVFEKGNAVIHLQRTTFKKQKEETFKEVTDKMYK